MWAAGGSGGRVFHDGEDIPRGVGEPGDGRSFSRSAVKDAFFVRFYFPFILFEFYARGGECVDGGIHAHYLQVQYGKGGWLMIGFWVEEDRIVFCDLHAESFGGLGYREAKDLLIEFFCLCEVVDGVAAECPGIDKHKKVF